MKKSKRAVDSPLVAQRKREIVAAEVALAKVREGFPPLSARGIELRAEKARCEVAKRGAILSGEPPAPWLEKMTALTAQERLLQVEVDAIDVQVVAAVAALGSAGNALQHTLQEVAFARFPLAAQEWADVVRKHMPLLREIAELSLTCRQQVIWGTGGILPDLSRPFVGNFRVDLDDEDDDGVPA